MHLGKCSTPYGNQRKITLDSTTGPACSARCSTPYGNQRKITELAYNCPKEGIPCSTPYGNQRKITSSHPRRRGSGRSVLNALRQSEENHSQGICSSSCNSWCSTPYGNQRKITSTAIANDAGAHSCSTPYGNQRKITQIEPRVMSHSQKCSTPYGNQRKITCNTLTSNSGKDSAQRLTAIRGKSLPIMPAVAPSLWSAQRLTAIRGKSQGLQPERNGRRLLCSTPYGNQRKITSIATVRDEL